MNAKEIRRMAHTAAAEFIDAVDQKITEKEAREIEELHHFKLFNPGLHPDTFDLLHEFSIVLAGKLVSNQIKYGYTNEWLVNDWEDECRAHMMQHIQKGDPRDVAIYAAFMWKRNWSTSKPKTADEGSREKQSQKINTNDTAAEQSDDAAIAPMQCSTSLPLLQAVMGEIMNTDADYFDGGEAEKQSKIEKYRSAIQLISELEAEGQ